MKTLQVALAALACSGSLGLANPTSSSTSTDTCTTTSTKSKSKRCTISTTIYSASTSYYFGGNDGTYSTYTSLYGYEITASTLTPTDGTATATLPPFTTVTTVLTTQTVTYGTNPTTTIGTPTVTIPAPSGFKPVQDTLKNATFDFTTTCRIITSLIPYTEYRFVIPTVTTTFYGPTHIVDGNATYTDPANFTSFSIVYASTTETSTTYIATHHVPSPSGTTVTVEASTQTIDEKCAATNFADSIITDGGTNAQPIWFQQLTANQSVMLQNVDGGASGCCQSAFAQGADAWGWQSDVGCFFASGPSLACKPKKNTFVAIFGPISLSPTLTVGNGPCGRWTKPTYSAGV